MWSVYVSCSLCSTRTGNHRHDEVKVADAAAEQEALAVGFLSLPEVKTPDRRRFIAWICGECRADIAAMS